MKFQVNLSRQPFYNRRLFWLVMAFLFVITGYLGIWSFKQIDARADEVKFMEKKVAAQRQELNEVKKNIPHVDIQSLTPSQVEQIQAAANLIEQRSFSWTAMLEEFERALPPDVRIVNIALMDKKSDLKNDL